RTHERDFAEAEPALLRLMQERHDWELLIVGFLELGEAWGPYQHRVRRQGFMPYLEMLRVLADCDINIAPLELGDMFCEAKSELKYFEAALVETPTVASPTEPFAAAIEHGVTGFLGADSDQWYDALRRLLQDEALRGEIGRNARYAALERFGIEATVSGAERALIEGKPRERPDPPKERRALSIANLEQRRLKIDWIIPRLIIGGGGHRNILRAAHHLQSFGHDVALHFTSSDDQASQLGSLVRNHFYPFEGSVKAYDGQFRMTDVIFATHWTTVDAALRAQDRTKEIMYFVQDFEPAFAPMGSEYVLAENTYRLGLYCITSGPWCEVMLKRDFQAEADHFRFPVDIDVYKPTPRTKPNTNLVFFAKPEMPRRCFEIGAMALGHVHRARPNVEIIMFGSSKAKEQRVDFPATYLEVVPTIQDLAQMYANADVGLVFSTTNPSLVPYEMMACGCPVVDLRRPGNEVNYGDRTDIAYLADPIPENMAREIVALLDNAEDRAARRSAGLEFVRGFPSEEGMARRIEELIFNRMAQRHSLSL
ncbi:MAG: glycosyltransferase family 4 protein, partial [Alphaproteobacteria bacterium]|nr:glycosyltransferase family 4 protein [Alphaproteobacteria bacterium]